MNYESFRAEFILRMQDVGLEDMTGKMVPILDLLAERYDFTAKHVELTVGGGLPEIIKIYLAARSIENLSKNTLDSYLITLRNFFDSVRKPFQEITANDVRLYLYKYKERRGIKDSTLETIRMIINSFFNWLCEEEYIQKNPVRKVPTIKFQYEERESLTEIELERIRCNCKTFRQKAIIDFLFSTGCRVSEATNMRICDIDFDTKEVRILHGKGDKFRVSFLNAESYISLKTYLASRTDSSPYLFVTNNNPHHKLNKKSVEVEIKKIAEVAQIQKNVTPHTFRHTAATMALRHGMKIEEVQKFLGHAKINTTLIYAKVDNASVKASHQKYVS